MCILVISVLLQLTQSPLGQRLPKKITDTHSQNHNPIGKKIDTYFFFLRNYFYFLFFHHTTCENTCDTLSSSAANQGDNTVSVVQGYWFPHRESNELIRDVLLWTLTHGRAKAGRPARTYIQQLCEDTGCCPEDLPRAMNDREEWRERVRDIRAISAT